MPCTHEIPITSDSPLPRIAIQVFAFLPVALPAFVPGASAEPWPILKPLLTTMLLPLVAGMVGRSRMPIRAILLKRIMERISNLAMLAAVVLLVALNSDAILGTFGSGAVAAG